MSNETGQAVIHTAESTKKTEHTEKQMPEVVILVFDSEKMCRDMKQLAEVFLDWLEQIDENGENPEEKGNADEPEVIEPPVVMMTVIPGSVPKMASPEEAAGFLDCFGESDEICVLTELNVLVSYDEKQLIQLSSGNYLVGPAVFFNVDEEGNDISLEAAELYNIQKYIEDNTVTLKNDTQEITAISLGEWR